MSGRKIVFYILAAFITGTLILVYIQYNFSKNINALTSGNQKYLDEYNINSALRELEKDVVRIESNVSEYVSTGNPSFIRDMGARVTRIHHDLGQLQQIADDTVSISLVDKLDTVVQRKVDFENALLDSLHNKGKGTAEKLINTLEGKQLMDSIYSLAQQVKDARHTLIKKLNDANIRSGQKAERLNNVLIVLTLISAAVLFWYIISIIQKLIDSEKKVKEAARIKENFMANMSHEIRTPMNAIMGFTTLLERQDLTPRAKEYLQSIQKSGDNLLSIINDILDLSKIEAGMMRIESAPFSIHALVHSVEVMFTARAAEKNIRIHTAIDDRVPPNLEGDAVRLTQILVNLVGNALKFTREGSITISIYPERQEGSVLFMCIRVEDTGIGIEKEKLAHIFDRFQQADDAVTRNYGGTGLGLSIVYELTLLQKGRIRVESEPGKGTVFHLEIPYRISSEPLADAGTAALPSFTGKFVSGNRRVLVAEDNEINQSLVAHLFSEWGLDYDITRNGREAIEKLKEKTYDLIFMDIQMPEMDGYTATREIRNVLGLETPIVAMTANALAGEKEKCLGYGMNDYLSKPIREKEMYELICRFIASPLTYPEKETVAATGFRYIRLQYMQEVSGGDKTYEKNVTGQFIEAVPEELAAINTAWSARRTEDVRRLAHNMRTTISVMGLHETLQPELDALEYDTLTNESFALYFHTLEQTCLAALAEANQLYLSL
jgi:signal transduction histidine kinase/CheY-like chemotaxis protein